MKIKLTNVRLAFPVLWTAKNVNGEGEPAFSASFIFAKDDRKNINLVQNAIEIVGKEKFGAKWAAIKKDCEAKDKLALHDGDLKAEYAGFEGNFYVSARNKTRPPVFDADKSILVEADGKPYGGCYVNAVVEIWAQDNKFGKRVNASLGGVQFYRDGDAFAGGGVANEDDFDDLSDTGEAKDDDNDLCY